MKKKAKRKENKEGKTDIKEIDAMIKVQQWVGNASIQEEREHNIKRWKEE